MKALIPDNTVSAQNDSRIIILVLWVKYAMFKLVDDRPGIVLYPDNLNASFSAPVLNVYGASLW